MARRYDFFSFECIYGFFIVTGSETPSRTSWSTFFTGESAQHPLVVAVEERISQLLRCPVVMAGMKELRKCEALQVRVRAGVLGVIAGVKKLRKCEALQV